MKLKRDKSFPQRNLSYRILLLKTEHVTLTLQNTVFMICDTSCRLQLKCDGTLWRTEWEVKGKLANGVGSHYPSHYLGTWCIQHYYR